MSTTRPTDAERWYAALMTSAADGTLNVATHGHDERALSERNGSARVRRPKVVVDANEIPF